MMTKRLLLHICCGPCSITTLSTLLDEGYDVTGLFYNPNIHPLTEYVKRRDGCLAVAERLGIKVIVKDDEYKPQEWFRDVAHRENNRCFHCYARRLERTAQIARKGNFDFFSTTLLYSKYQRHAEITALGYDLESAKTKFLYHDFREGWQEGIATSKDWGIYRQQYCGCLYSENERYKKELET